MNIDFINYFSFFLNFLEINQPSKWSEVKLSNLIFKFVYFTHEFYVLLIQ